MSKIWLKHHNLLWNFFFFFFLNYCFWPHFTKILSGDNRTSRSIEIVNYFLFGWGTRVVEGLLVLSFEEFSSFLFMLF